VGIVDESEGNGRVRNCPDVTVTNEFYKGEVERRRIEKLQMHPKLGWSPLWDLKLYLL